ncbi:hypothetical protein EJ04DRAFT_513008 [Polyplosphaeria fusca]|uniref:Uncharacterized protein n=1 Tax=Polyplosphaeria fusca TaxID=682080 RepID=A0A9P4V247_9PLEO|nr:hypothetical protein EJ04DRAFT_513008 [Polyplosphaeria fusca]
MATSHPQLTSEAMKQYERFMELEAVAARANLEDPVVAWLKQRADQGLFCGVMVPEHNRTEQWWRKKADAVNEQRRKKEQKVREIEAFIDSIDPMTGKVREMTKRIAEMEIEGEDEMDVDEDSKKLAYLFQAMIGGPSVFNLAIRTR